MNTMTIQDNKTLLDVRNLSIAIRSRKGSARVVDDVSFSVCKGETLGVVGESGCGKSITMLGLTGLLPNAASIASGSVDFEGHDLARMEEKELRNIRGGRIGFIFQDPMTSLNPVMTLGAQLAEPMMQHRGVSREVAYREAAKLLTMVGVSGGESRLSQYPHQLSGGMRQRVMIAMSIICQPSLLIADEPTTALDVTVQRQVAQLIKSLSVKLGLSVIWISHDLALVSQIAERIVVLYAGKIVEQGPVEDMYLRPRHPYTKALLASLPSVADHRAGRRLPAIKGALPDPRNRPPGCPFAPRCPDQIERCWQAMPEMTRFEKGHDAACFVAELKESAQ